MDKSFGNILKTWRRHRRYSQLQMAEEVGISSRHLSFLETGRSAPSKEVVLRIGEFLRIPKRDINRMLVVSGFAPVFRDLLEPNTNLEPIYFAIDKLLNDHMPFPALVLNREWDVVKANQAAVRTMKHIGFVGADNLIECFIADDPHQSKIVNWGETVSILLNRLKCEIDILGADARIEKLEQQLRAHLGRHNIPEAVDYSQSTLNTSFRVEGKVLSYFSLVSQMSAILDVSAAEFKIELMFPADECTKQYHLKRS